VRAEYGSAMDNVIPGKNMSGEIRSRDEETKKKHE
jgi:hypothetical protein